MNAIMMPLLTALVSEDLAEAHALHSQIEHLAPALERAAVLCADALRLGGKIVLFGNGGSAADAQHIAAEFIGRFETERVALPAIALTVNTSVLTALGNDYDFSVVFERQVQALVKKGDVVIGLSTSGNSENVIRGLLMARSIGANTIGLSGKGGRMQASVDVSLAVPSSHTPRIQEVHILLGHILTHAVETLLMEKPVTASAKQVAMARL